METLPLTGQITQIMPKASTLLKCLCLGLATSLAWFSEAHGDGIAAIKDQDFHSDSAAQVLIYSRIIAPPGPYVKIVTSQRTINLQRSKFAGNVDVMTQIPSFIESDQDLAPVRLSLEQITNFSKKFTKSEPLLKPHIAALQSHIQKFEDNQVRHEGVWIPRMEYAKILAKEAREQKENELKRQEEREELERKKVRAAKIASEQDKKGLAYDGKEWVPKDQINHSDSEIKPSLGKEIAPIQKPAAESLKSGDKISILKTKSGTIYTDVTIREVAIYGLKIFHIHGASTIAAEELPQYSHLFGTPHAIEEIRERMENDTEKWHQSQTAQNTAPKKTTPTTPTTTGEKHAETITPAKPATFSRVNLQAQTVAMGRKETNSENFWVGSSPTEEVILYNNTKQIFRHRTVGVSISNTGTNPDLILEVFWLGNPLQNKNEIRISQYAARVIRIKPGSKSDLKVSSNYHYMDQTLVYLKRESRNPDYWNGLLVKTWAGYGYAGWIVRVSDGKGRTLAVQAARPPLAVHIKSLHPPTLK
jgi:hypothetical protein